MIPRSIRFFAALALAAACGTPEVPHTPSPSSVVTAVFDPIGGQIPLPNDLALQQIPPSLPPAQQDLLNAFKAQGGFPNDQEVPITISFVRTSIAADGTTSNSPPTLDTTTLTPATLVAVLQTAQGIGPVALDPITDANYVNGVLTLHNKNRAPWTPGHYVVGVRRGPNGAKTKEGDPIYASSTFYLIAQGQNLETDQGITLLRAQTGSTEAAIAAAQQLDQIINGYKAGPFQAIDQVFPHQELVAMTTFAIAPLKTQVQLDANRGLVPLPIDLLRDATGHISAQGACALAQGTFNPATGACTSAAAAAFQTLDGFATTGAILAPLSDLVSASTITSAPVTLSTAWNASTPPASVTLWDISNPASPVQINSATYITEPSEVTQQGLSPVIALQPAGATAGDATSVFRTRPLKDSTDYAVVITDGVKDKVGKPIGPGTVATILQFIHPVFANGSSQLLGVDNTTAAGLEVMRQKIASLVGAPAFKGHVAMAYTFHTQTILSPAVQLGALPYTKDVATAATAAPTAMTPGAAFAKYGVDVASVPAGNIAEVLETTLTTFNLLNPATGAFNPTGATTDETINVLIAYPKATVTFPACSNPALAAFGNCSPLVVFRHGLGGGRADMLTVADTLAGKGFTVVAIDAAKHGDRSFCMSGLTNVPGTSIPQCFGQGATCTAIPGTAGQGDANPPGTCGGSGFTYRAVSAACSASPASCGWFGTEGIPVVSSSYLVSANFFRTRDTLRQDIIDQSQLVRAVAYPPSGPPSGSTPPLFNYLVGKNLVIDPAQVYFLGQSLGSIQGTLDVATNPRISRAVLNVGGGTVVDVFTTSPAFAANTNALLASLGIQPGANSAYLQFLVVAKTILDPADPVNFAGHLSSNTLPNLLPPLGGNPNGTVPQAPKAVLTQAAFCDQVVPNPWNFVLDSNAGSTPLPPTGAPGTFELFFTGTTPPGLTDCPSPTSGLPPPASSVAHGFITSWASTSATGATAVGQARAAGFLSGTPSPSSVVPVQ